MKMSLPFYGRVQYHKLSLDNKSKPFALTGKQNFNRISLEMDWRLSKNIDRRINAWRAIFVHQCISTCDATSAGSINSRRAMPASGKVTNNLGTACCDHSKTSGRSRIGSLTGDRAMELRTIKLIPPGEPQIALVSASEAEAKKQFAEKALLRIM
ncbi:MAG: hypothetical protein K2Z81_12925 [Cyanobacteria bacterium]|nr:hypothetical protein [Cyanobacteriota bacterium]